MNFYLPTKVISGNDCVKKNAALLAGLGKSCIIVTGKSSAKLCGALDDVTEALKSNNIKYVVYDKIRQNPEIQSCFEAAELAKSNNAEFVIGIGGGSPLDAAKAVAVLTTNDVDENGMYAGNWQNAPLPIIAVGTTAGTGSEVTQVAVITDKNGKKRSFRDDKAFPALSFGDTRYTAFMPENVMRSTAIDAFAHCVESYYCSNSTDISRAFAVMGMKKLVTAFKYIVKGDTLTDVMREDIYNASLYGGVAISVTGTSFPHALGYFLSEDHGIAHGTACGIYLPEFLRYNDKNAKSLADSLYSALNADCDMLCTLIENVMPEVKVAVTAEQMDALMPRWVNCKCLPKMYGDADEKTLDNIIRKTF